MDYMFFKKEGSEMYYVKKVIIWLWFWAHRLGK